jgi:hypothetical protein
MNFSTATHRMYNFQQQQKTGNFLILTSHDQQPFGLVLGSSFQSQLLNHHSRRVLLIGDDGSNHHWNDDFFVVLS